MDRGLFRLLSVLVLCALIGGYVACAVEIEGVIFINSDPEGANIFLKSLPVEGSPEGSLSVEDLIGVTPMQFQYPPGNYMIYLQKFGYVSWWEEIVVDNGQITQVNGGIPVELANQELRYGALHIETNPADADIVLERVIDPSDPQRIENSKVHGKTPLSLESLPPGRYDYTITKEGYETITSKGSTDYAPIEVMAGVVSERSFPLQLIPTTVPVRFNSLPVGAEVYVFPFLSKYEGVDLEALDSDEIFDEIEAEASKFTLGYIGYTPTTFEMPAGKWMYMMKKDSHYPVIGMFTAVVGNPQDINRKLRPFPQFVEVYFEVGGAKQNDGANVAIKHKGRVLGQTPSQNNCSITGIECFGVWVSLPAEMIVDVVFSKEHFRDLPVKVDTSLFKGRPSKWGKLIELDRLNYTLTPRADEFSRIDPAGRQTVVAEECGGAFLISVRPEYSPDYVIKDITLNNSSFIDIPPNQINFELRMDKDKGICDIGPIVGNSILSVESERREYTIELVVGPGGSALCDGSPCDDEIETEHKKPKSTKIPVYSGDDSPAITFTPDEDYEILRVLVNGRPDRDYDPLIIHEVRKDYRVEVQFRPTKVTITPIGDMTHGTFTPTEPYQIDYNACTQRHDLSADDGYIGGFITWPTDDGRPEFMAAATMDYWFQQCGVTQNLTVEAVFHPPLFDITAVAHGNGNITPSGTWEVKRGSDQRFILTADPGNSLIKLTDNGVDVTDEIRIHDEGDDADFTDDGVNKGKRNWYVLSNITENHTIEAFFTGSSDYVVITPSWNPKGGGSIDPSKAQVVKRGSNVEFTITANSCHTIGSIVIEDIDDPFSAQENDSLSADSGPYPSPKTVTLNNVQNSKNLIVNFVPKVYNIDVTQAEGGTITPAGLVQVTCGDDVTFDIIPDDGNEVHSLIIDGVEYPGEQTYTFTNVVESHTFSAIFVIPPVADFAADLCGLPHNYPVNFEDPSYVCRAPLNHPVTFEDLSKNRATEWIWEVGDGTILTGSNPTHRYTKTGTYSVRLTVKNAAGGDTLVKENFITITTNPIAKFTIEPEEGVVLVGEAVKVIDQSLNAGEKDNVSFAWDFGDGKGGFGDGQGTVTLKNPPPYTYDSPGVYRIGLKVEKPYIATATDYYYQTVTVIQKPIADFQTASTSPLTVEFKDASRGFPTQWLWDFGNGALSYDVNPTHVYSEPGVYTVTLFVKSDEGEDQKTKEITVA